MQPYHQLMHGACVVLQVNSKIMKPCTCPLMHPCTHAPNATTCLAHTLRPSLRLRLPPPCTRPTTRPRGCEWRICSTRATRKRSVEALLSDKKYTDTNVTINYSDGNTRARPLLLKAWPKPLERLSHKCIHAVQTLYFCVYVWNVRI